MVMLTRLHHSYFKAQGNSFCIQLTTQLTLYFIHLIPPSLCYMELMVSINIQSTVILLLSYFDSLPKNISNCYKRFPKFSSLIISFLLLIALIEVLFTSKNCFGLINHCWILKINFIFISGRYHSSDLSNSFQLFVLTGLVELAIVEIFIQVNDAMTTFL
jgi:hypothetical protein